MKRTSESGRVMPWWRSLQPCERGAVVAKLRRCQEEPAGRSSTRAAASASPRSHRTGVGGAASPERTAMGERLPEPLLRTVTWDGHSGRLLGTGRLGGSYLA